MAERDGVLWEESLMILNGHGSNQELFGDVDHAAVGETSAIMAIRPGIPKMERITREIEDWSDL